MVKFDPLVGVVYILGMSNSNVILQAAFDKYMISLINIYDFVDVLGLRRRLLQWVASLTMVLSRMIIL